MSAIPREAAHIQLNPVTALIARLAAYAGFDEEVLESARMDSIIQRRRRLHTMESVDAYLAFVEQDAAEHDALLNEVLVGETRFFRDARVFDHLQEWLLQRGSEGKPLRVLCAPCSTGEEAYSVAASLQVSGFAPGQYEVEALDISRSALEIAERGVYGAHALRGVDEERRGLLVQPVDETHWRVHDELRPGLSFSFANLSLPGSLEPLGGFDLILCRNLLIYLRPEARLNLLQSLHAALRPGGRLILGTGDAVPEVYTIFQVARPASSFMLEPKQHVQTPPRQTGSVPVMPKITVVPKPIAPATALKRAAVSALPEPDDLYRKAHELFEQEDLRQAERHCRKALYLEPSHVPSLELLEQLWRNEPASRRSRALVERLGRARQQQQETA